MAEKTTQSPFELKGLSKYFSLSFYRTLQRAVWTFCELGIADLMANHKHPITASELSQLNGNNWNAEFLYRLLRVIADADIVTQIKTDHENLTKPEETIRYQLTEDGLFLTSDHYSKTCDMIRFDLNPNGDRINACLPSIIKDGYKNGTGYQQAYGCSAFEYMKKEENKEYANLFNNTMITYSYYTISAVLPIMDLTRFKTVVDIGGGLGTLLSFVLQKYQHLHGILFDLEYVIENVKRMNPNEFQSKQIESDRYELIGGDMFKSETIPPADAYILKSVIHDWNDEKSIEIFQSIRQANKNQIGKIITIFLIESMIQSNDKDNWEAHSTDLRMLIVLGSKERTLDEYANLFKNSGYEFKHVYKTNSFMSIIEATTTI